MHCQKRKKNNTAQCFCFFPLTGSRALTPVPCFGTQTAAADRGESQGALWMCVEGSAAERIRGC